jgi:CheY-like chemotaxis protein
MTGLSNGLHVLVIEDESLVAMLIEDMLEDLGAASITVAANIGGSTCEPGRVYVCLRGSGP